MRHRTANHIRAFPILGSSCRSRDTEPFVIVRWVGQQLVDEVPDESTARGQETRTGSERQSYPACSRGPASLHGGQTFRARLFTVLRRAAGSQRIGLGTAAPRDSSTRGTTIRRTPTRPGSPRGDSKGRSFRRGIRSSRDTADRVGCGGNDVGVSVRACGGARAVRVAGANSAVTCSRPERRARRVARPRLYATVTYSLLSEIARPDSIFGWQDRKSTRLNSSHT